MGHHTLHDLVHAAGRTHGPMRWPKEFPEPNSDCLNFVPYAGELMLSCDGCEEGIYVGESTHVQMREFIHEHDNCEMPEEAWPS